MSNFGWHSGVVHAKKVIASILQVTGNAVIISNAGVPVDGTTGDNFAGKGSVCIDITNGDLYINSGSITAPVWKLVTRAA
jgi:hypothetical protein